jgi:hypothetical protein
VKQVRKSSLFENKEAKKLHSSESCGLIEAPGHRSESFLLLFFKKEALTFLP